MGPDDYTTVSLIGNYTPDFPFLSPSTQTALMSFAEIMFLKEVLEYGRKLREGFEIKNILLELHNFSLKFHVSRDWKSEHIGFVFLLVKYKECRAYVLEALVACMMPASMMQQGFVYLNIELKMFFSVKQIYSFSDMQQKVGDNLAKISFQYIIDIVVVSK